MEFFFFPLLAGLAVLAVVAWANPSKIPDRIPWPLLLRSAPIGVAILWVTGAAVIMFGIGLWIIETNFGIVSVFLNW